MNARRYFSLAFSMLSLAFASCGNETLPPVETISFEADGKGYLQFSTNDPDLYRNSFLHIPDVPENSFAKDAASAVSIDAVKVWGNRYTGYGLVFAYKDSLNYLALLLAANGGYKIIKCVSGTLADVSDWTSFSAVRTFGSVNTIAASYVPDANNSYYLLSINGVDLGQPLYYNSSQTTKAGFYVWVADTEYEHFPKYVSEQRFKMTLPVVYPAAP